MKNYDSRIFGISDVVDWDRQDQLRLNPAFQRRQVWTEKAKSYLIDTILRGKPIPKIFIRQILNVKTRSSIREVVDGQQRFRTILSYVKDGFSVSSGQNTEFGGKLFSQLPDEVQAQFLSYELSVDLLINLPDPDVLDIFSRLNSYAVILNTQEKLNANHFGAFKVLADQIGYKYNSYWKTQGLLSDSQILRMGEISLVADLIIAMIEGIKSKKQIKKYYDQYEKKFDYNVATLTRQFDSVINAISKLFPDGIKGTEFRRIHLFYSLFTAVAHSTAGLPEYMAARIPLKDEKQIARARHGLDRVGAIFAATDVAKLEKPERDFVEDSRRATTDEAVRERRATFLIGLMA